MADFDEFLREMKKRGLNFVMDLVINHSSDEHEWFQKSIEKIEPYNDYYVWVDPKAYNQDGKPIPPNNWPSIFDYTKPSSGWTWNEQRNQYYWHHFHAKQPDFNLRNENVKKELQALMKFWLDKGVTAFRVDAAPFLMEDPLLREEDYGNEFAKIEAGTEERSSRRFHHPDNFPFLNEMYLFLRQYDKKNKKERETAMMTEAYAATEVIIKYYGTKKTPSSHFTFNYQITTLKKYLDAREMIDHLNNWIDRLPQGAAQNWAVS
ncbi:maltase A1-like [Planococcus citri]|uniref:maltase A1-like n=1 Tax=Planococcus citri TaxID=170843 RepID=UPI0031F9C207